MGNFPNTMEQNTRNNGKYLQRHQLQTEKEENNTETGNGHSGTKKIYHNHRLKKHIINLSTYVQSTAEKTLLSKSLNFNPTPYKVHPAKIV